MEISIARAHTSPHPKYTYLFSQAVFVFRQNGWAQPSSGAPTLWRGCEHGRCWRQNRAGRIRGRRWTHDQRGTSEDVSYTWLVRKSSTGGSPTDPAALLFPFSKADHSQEASQRTLWEIQKAFTRRCVNLNQALLSLILLKHWIFVLSPDRRALQVRNCLTGKVPWVWRRPGRIDRRDSLTSRKVCVNT